MLKQIKVKLLFLLVVSALLAACVAQPQVSGVEQTIVVTQTVETEIPSPSVTPSPAPTSTIPPAPSPLPSQTLPRTAQNAASGWTIYSNPDFVNGVTVVEKTLWAATMGGVVAWNTEAESYRLYTTRDGLVEIQGNDIVFCPQPEPRLYVAHESSSLSAYDFELKKWSHVPISFEDGTTMNGIQSMFCDKNNLRLIIGSGQGLGILDLSTGRWSQYGRAQGLVVKEIRSIDVVGQTIWIATGPDSAFMIMGKTLFPFSGTSGFPNGPVHDISVSADASIWLAYPSGLIHYTEPTWKAYGGQTRVGIPFISIDLVEVGSGSTIWIAGSTEGACPFDTVTFFCSSLYPALPNAPFSDLIVGPDDTAYIGTEGGGVMVIDDEGLRILSMNRDQLASNDIYDIAESQDGRLWIATDRGVNTFNPSTPMEPWQFIPPARGKLLYPHVAGLQTAVNGMWFYYGQKQQATFFDGQQWSQLDSLKGITADILDAEIDVRGYTWFATSQGVNVWDGAVMRSYGSETGLPGSVYRTVYAEDDTVWVGTDRGLLQYSRYQWSVPLVDVPVNTIIPDRSGGLLLGTDIGLVRFDGQESYVWVINLGSEALLKTVVTSLAWDHDNQLWVGTDGDGLFHYDGNRWERYNAARGLPTNRIRKVFTDHLGAVWIVTYTGTGGGALARYKP